MTYKFASGKFNYTAYRISDEKFYNLSGAGSRTEPGYPLPVTTRLSSPFNPAHLSPVSERVNPHNGIDCSVLMDTRIISVINGEVARAGYNSAVGYFVEVSGKDNAKTCYLRLSKILVKKGTSASRRTTIALSGNSRHSSGPHLHYELVVNNNPVSSLAFGAVGPADNNKFEQHVYVHARDYGRYLN